MMSSETCIVYVLTNEAMPTYIKIGTTDRSIIGRMKQLYSTGVPVPFECYYAAKVPKSTNVEKRIHRAFDKFRVNQNREFFEMEPEAAADIIRLVAISEVTPVSDFVETIEDKKAIEKLEKRAERFSFKMVGIEPETVLTFKLDATITCEVIDNRQVRFQGQPFSLSGAALEALKLQGYYWKSAQGAQYWKHGDLTLLELRDALENED